MSFEFAFEPKYRPLLAVLGVFPHTAWVSLTDDELEARFGLWRCRTPIANIVGVEVSGPYQAIKAIGARGSLADGGATFGTTAAGGVCLKFAEPVKILDPTGRFRHPGLTVTVADPEEFAAAVTHARARL
ncbi:MAG: hypothetical protein QG597_3304 [Actinomycetota bacterium]|nr:hypothetical protein [Actinomycetota bacterium]